MFELIGCISKSHDMRLVLIACIICAVGAVATFQTLARAQAAAGKIRVMWVAASGTAFGCGVWVTHFVGMLAFEAGMSIGFDLRLTSLSLLLAIVGGCLSLACAVATTRTATVLSGLMLGTTIGIMHFAGMAAMQVPGLIEYSAREVVAAWVMALIFAPLALLQFRKGSIAKASILLVMAVAGLHFTAMAAITILPDGSALTGVAVTMLAVAIASAGLLIVSASLSTALFDKHLAHRKQCEHERFRRFADATFEGLFFLDHGTVQDANRILCRMMGYTLEEVVGAKISSFFAPECQDALDAIEANASDGTEAILICQSGQRQVVDVLVRPHAASNGFGTVVAIRDASERKRAEQRLQELAHIDPLTGLGNRLMLRDRLTQALAIAERSGTSVAVLCLDLDHLKEVNDRFGYQAGDSVLVQMGKRLVTSARDTDTVVRLGGGEFIIVQPFAGQPESAQTLAESLLELLAEPYEQESISIHVTVSIGISFYPGDAMTADMLLNNADLALSRARQEGRDCCRFFEPAMDTALRERRELEHDIRHALGNGELFLHYQPVFDSGQLRLVGYEALLRWRHPRRGLVSPGEFIPMAEECGLIASIGEWVLQTACAEAASWAEPWGVAVNLSPIQFKNRNLALQVSETLARTCLAPERLEIEVTEGLLIADTETALKSLRELKGLGVRVALDDFGTGYSSLSYLRLFPFDRLKIDRSFVAELGIDAGAEAIIDAIISLSRSLHLEVTAEGIETEAQLEILRSLKCNVLQGYLLGRPAPAEEIAHRWISATVAA